MADQHEVLRRNETFFEQAYLASYLGLPLVRGSDLTPKDGGIHLLSLEGSRRVDVILRRVDDTFCDPLELNGSSLLGVPEGPVVSEAA